jgi:hypothetical protein
MSIRLYEQYKELYNSVKPIRGRSVEVRPINDRRRDWEQVICKVMDDGQVAYGARFHSTDVFLIMPNGDLKYDCGAHYSPTTAEFMGSLVFGIYVRKQHGMLWVGRNAGTERFCAALREPVLVRWDTTNPNYQHYRLDKPSVVLRRVVDTVAAKKAREPINEFRKYASAVLKMSDNKLTGEFMRTHFPDFPNNKWYSQTTIGGVEYRGGALYNFNAFNDEQNMVFYEAMGTEDEDKRAEIFPKLLAMMAFSSRYYDSHESSGAVTITPEAVARLVDKVVFAYRNVYKNIEVEVTKPVTDVVGIV